VSTILGKLRQCGERIAFFIVVFWQEFFIFLTNFSEESVG